MVNLLKFPILGQRTGIWTTGWRCHVTVFLSQCPTTTGTTSRKWVECGWPHCKTKLFLNQKSLLLVWLINVCKKGYSYVEPATPLSIPFLDCWFVCLHRCIVCNCPLTIQHIILDCSDTFLLWNVLESSWSCTCKRCRTFLQILIFMYFYRFYTIVIPQIFKFYMYTYIHIDIDTKLQTWLHYNDSCRCNIAKTLPTQRLTTKNQSIHGFHFLTALPLKRPLLMYLLDVHVL